MPQAFRISISSVALWSLLVAATVAQDLSALNPLRPAEPAPTPPPAAEQTAPPATAAAGDAQTPAGTAPAAATPATEPTTPPNNDNTPPVREALTTKQIEELLARVDTLELSEDEKKQAKQFYQEALAATTELEQQKAIKAEMSIAYTDKDTIGHPKAWYAEQLAKPIAETLTVALPPEDLSSLKDEELEDLSTQLTEHGTRWSRRLAELGTSEATHKEFLNNLPTTKQGVEQKLADTTKQAAELIAQGMTSEAKNAQLIALQQRQAKLEAELLALEEKRKAYVRETEAHDLELELAQRKADIYSKSLTRVREELNLRRQREADARVKAAEREADRYKELIERNGESLGVLSRTNQELAKEIQTLVDQEQQVTMKTTLTTSLHTLISSDYKEYQDQFGDNAKLSQTSGELLRKQREKLPRPTILQSQIIKRTNQRNDIDFAQFNAEQELKALEDRDAAVGEYLEKVQPEDRAAAAPVIRKLLETREELLESYGETLNDLEGKLSLLISEKINLKTTAEDFRNFIAERDLWIRSCRPLWASNVQLTHDEDHSNWQPFYLYPTIEAFAWSLYPQNWITLLDDLQRSVTRQPFLTGMLAMLVLLLIYIQGRCRKQLRELGEQAAKKNCTDFAISLRAVWLTVLISLPWPLLLWSIGRVLNTPTVESDFSLAFSQAAMLTAWMALLAEFTRQCCRTNGLAEAHLNWQHATLMQLRRYLRWIPVVVLPLVFWQVALDSQSSQSLRSDSLGRLLFITVLLYTIFVLGRIFLSHNSSLYQLLTRGSENWWVNLNRAWRPAVVVVPVALVGMALLGYYYTAEQLAQRILLTFAMLLVLLICGGLMQRWVLLNRRTLAREQAQKRRAQLLAAANEGDEVASVAEIVEETVDLTALSLQTRKLLHVLLVLAGVVGVFVVWKDVFPALSWLDETSLPWSEGDAATTWGHVLRALLASVITYVAVRDIPSLLELVVLQHLPIDSGARYATATLARYTILAIGIVVTAASLGITSTSIGWLVAAMGVGLGFGLQEIFANFVSGIILLFERPIRVGDIITLGEKTGIVSRIRIRATTITDWDRKEYIVPNKDLVTERLLNWTLSDQTNRVVIEVGIAYGTDTDRACDLLREIVQAHPIVLDDPAPLINFDGFGDSTLNLVVRCYLPNLENRLLTIHDLHTEINKRFNAEGIEIAFPQRDLHIRSMPPQWNAPAKEEKTETDPPKSE